MPEYHSIPIIINNYNRLDSLKQLIHSLESRGYANIIILDNASTYPPLLEYYKTIPYDVVHLGGNYGFMALWRTAVYKRFKSSFYVYTDPDIVLDKQCPDDFMEFLLSSLKRHPSCLKIGLGIRIDDLPDCYKDKSHVVSWETQYWQNRVDDYLFIARVDTTFALYRPYCKGGSSPHLTYRTDFPYVIRHLPWYNDSNNLSDEERYYIAHSKTATHWTSR
ncbi:MAG: glycosyltransferase family 2 protein [Bacteroidales bacterium]|nr:glycosyltransferase family 2 protein [Bacteroidales bacterium]